MKTSSEEEDERRLHQDECLLGLDKGYEYKTLDALRCSNSGVDNNTCRANFQQRSFLATFTRDVLLARCSL